MSQPLSRRLNCLKCAICGFACLNFVFFLTLLWETPTNYWEQSYVTSFNGILKSTATWASPQSTFERHKMNTSTDLETGQVTNHLQSSACMLRSVSDFQGITVEMNKQPFLSDAKTMVCTSNETMAVFGDKFALFLSVIVDPSKTNSVRQGGERMDRVMNQSEETEYFSLLPGYFKAPCLSKPVFRFNPKDHLNTWGKSLECYHEKANQLSTLHRVLGTTVAVQRYEYVNLYFTVCDFYNAFVMMLYFGIGHSRMNILFVDAHPEGGMDKAWKTLFDNTIRAGKLSKPVIFGRLVWGLLSYFSPLTINSNENVPFLEEFRNYVLSRFNVSSSHTRDCNKLHVIVIWRHDYVAHPRNPTGRIKRKFQNEAEILRQTQRTMGQGSRVLGVQLDRLSMKEQLELISTCDILVGMHGAGLSHTLFLPPTSALLEMMPKYAGVNIHFESMARWRKLPYRRWHNEDEHLEMDNWKTRVPLKVSDDNLKVLKSMMCSKARVWNL